MPRPPRSVRSRPVALVAAALVTLVAFSAAIEVPATAAPEVAALFASTSTTTTLATGTTTTTMFSGVDVSGGGDFEGSFPANSFDSYVFELAEPRVLVAETSNGFGGCPGDTLLELRRPGAPANCGGVYGDDLPCVAFDDDSGITVCSKIVKYLAQPGSYEIRVSTYGGVKLNRYFLHVEFAAVECGNGVVELTEGCDDGNSASGDCCSSTCQKEAQNSPCNDGLFCNGSDACNAAGSCAKHLGDPCAGADGDGNCAESCDESSDGCTAADPNGSACNDGLFCDGADSCQGGSCSGHAGDPCAGADGDGNCAESCNEAGDSCTAPDANGSPCNDGLFCNGTDSCQAGACGGHAGTPCPEGDGDANCNEGCNESNDTCTSPEANGTPCDDGVFCNGADHCIAGSCGEHAGNPCPGPDGDDDCSEGCNEAGDSCSSGDPDMSACDDGLFCNGLDRCSGGLCSVHAGDPCFGGDGDGDCSESCDEAADLCDAPDQNGSPCDDGLLCNGADSCSDGSCATHAVPSCPGADGDANCAESCSDSAPGCVGNDPNGSTCDDGVFCNGPDRCSNGSCSVHLGNPCPGADGDGNCVESCNEATDDCTAPDPKDSSCDDGNACTATSKCDAGGGCVSGDVLDCDDHDDCTIDACSAGGTACSHTPVEGCSNAVCGDVSGDGAVKASDALAVLKSAVGGTQCAAEPCVCDASGDGSIKASDALLVLKLAVGSPVSTNCKC